MTNPPVTDLSAAPLFIMEQLPRATPATLRPFIYAICLANGGVTASDVVTAAHSFFSPLDNKLYDENEEGARTCLEILAEALLIAMVDGNELRYNPEKQLFVMATASRARWLSIATTLNSALPAHFIVDLQA